jgi:hypothetical protein
MLSSFASIWGTSLSSSGPYTISTESFDTPLVINRAALVSGNEAVLYITIQDKKFALGTLRKGHKEHINLELRFWDILDEKYDISVTGDGKVDLTGYFHPPEDDFGSLDEFGSELDDEYDEDDEEENNVPILVQEKPQPAKGGKQPKAAIAAPQPAKGKQQQKPKQENKPPQQQQQKGKKGNNAAPAKTSPKVAPESPSASSTTTTTTTPTTTTEAAKPAATANKKTNKRKAEDPAGGGVGATKVAKTGVEYKCTACSKIFGSENSLATHNKAKHPQ